MTLRIHDTKHISLRISNLEFSNEKINQEIALTFYFQTSYFARGIIFIIPVLRYLK